MNDFPDELMNTCTHGLVPIEHGLNGQADYDSCDLFHEVLCADAHQPEAVSITFTMKPGRPGIPTCMCIVVCIGHTTLTTVHDS